MDAGTVPMSVLLLNVVITAANGATSTRAASTVPLKAPVGEQNFTRVQCQAARITISWIAQLPLNRVSEVVIPLSSRNAAAVTERAVLLVYLAVKETRHSFARRGTWV